MTTQERIVAAIKGERTLAKHIYKHVWTSGSTTEVYPITLWERSVDVQMDTHRNYFDKAIARVLAKHSDLFSNGYFCKNDDSCPAEVRFIYTEETKKSLKQ